MPVTLQGRSGNGLSLFIFMAAMAASATSAAACPSGAKCVSLGDGGVFASSNQSNDGALFIRAPKRLEPVAASAAAPSVNVAPIVAIGDQLERGRYNMVIDSAYHALPPAPAGAIYFEVDGKVLVVEQSTMRVIGDVTNLAARIY